jgi:hypothetical protein
MKSKSNIIIKSIVFISFLILFYLIFRYFSSDHKSYHFTYILITISGLIFWIGIFFLSEDLKQKILLVFFSSYITLLSFEIYLNIYGHYKELGTKPFIYYKKYLKADKNFVRPIYPSVFSNNKQELWRIFNFAEYSKEIYPLTGISNRPTLMCAESGFWVTYNSDRYGFNNNDEVWDKKNIDILLVGDSFVHGFCVKNDNNFSGKIKKYSGKNVLSIGYGGTGPLVQLGQLIEFGLYKKPKKIIWFFGEGNDLKNLKDESTHTILKKYMHENFSQNLKSKQKEIDKILLKILNKYIIKNEKLETDKEELEKGKALFLKNIIKLYNVRKITINKLLKIEQTRDEITKVKKLAIERDLLDRNPNNLKNFEQIMEIALNLSKSINSELYFVYLPTYSRYLDVHAHATESQMFNRKIILDIINKLNIPIIDIHSKVFKLEKDPISLYPYRKNRHFNKEAFDKASKVIVNNIKEY